MTADITTIKAGLAIVLLGFFINLGMGISFGVDEDAYKDYIAEGVAAHPELHNETSAAKIWRYALRAHFHAGGIAGYCLGLVILVMFSTLSRKFKQGTAVLIGLGSLYPLSWLSMFLLSPAIGRGPAHEHFLTLFFTYVGVGGLLLGSATLVANLLFGLFGNRSDA